MGVLPKPILYHQHLVARVLILRQGRLIEINRNMDLATDVYISLTNHCSCGETVINMFKGSDSSEKQEERKYLIQFLKGSKMQKESLKKEHSALYSYFEQVWNVTW